MAGPKHRKLSRPAAKTAVPAAADIASDAFDSDEPLTDPGATSSADDDDEAELEMPPMTMGQDSTKATAFDKLPWRSVKLPQVAGEGWGLDGEGGLLGLEELDGEEWDRYAKRIKGVPSEGEAEIADGGGVDGKEEVGASGNEEAGEVEGAEDEAARASKEFKEKRKQAKKERLAAARLEKKAKREADQAASVAMTEPAPTTNGQTEESQSLGVMKKEAKATKKDPEHAKGEDILAVKWSAAADVDMSDMDADSHSPPSASVTDLLTAPFDTSLLPGWSAHPLSAPMKRSIHALGFSTPTPVQSAVLETVLMDEGRDVVAVAQTGSGKTMAYALPIVQGMLLQKWRLDDGKGEGEDGALPIAALVLTPTRELCLQVAEHIDRLLAHIVPRPSSSTQTTGVKADSKSVEGHRNRSGIHVVPVCGGIASIKQRRLLSRSLSSLGTILVATPGRLWDLLQTWDELGRGVRKVKWLVVDEADRMTERGRFEEVERIVGLTRRSGRESEEFVDEWRVERQEGQEVGREDMKTMVFSATMDIALQKDVKRRGAWRRRRGDEEGGHLSALDRLLETLDFRDPDPAVLDLTPEKGVVEGLKECKIECLTKDKDVYLYHFLLRYPGRTLVFLSSIAALRRLSPLLSLLLPSSSPILTLHSSMPQRSRLKNLDRFRQSEDAVMLATDVAARGLDVPEVQHVVHYQVPRSADGYVHRSGRTARAGMEGVSLVMIGPDEVGPWRALMRTLRREDDLGAPPFEHSILDRLRERLELAKRIDELEHTARKSAHDDNWLQKAANAMGIDVDSDENLDGASRKPSKKTSKVATAAARDLRAQLVTLLKRPLVLAGVRQGRYLTAGDDVVRALVEGKGHRQLVGLREGTSAVAEVGQTNKAGKRKRK